MSDATRKPRSTVSLKDRVALVTGATRGIGASIAAALADAGAKVLITGRDAAGADQVLKEIAGRGGRASYIPSNLQLDGDVDALVPAALARHGKLDVLVNNAGIDVERLAFDYELDDWRRVMRFNVEVPFRLSLAAARHFVERGGGSIINISSILGQVGGAEECAYSPSKHALNGLTKTLAIEWASKGIRVNGIAPGLIKTEMTRYIWESEALGERIRTRYPVGRMGEPHDIAGLAVFLASDAADFIHGQIIAVDGGRTA